MRVRIAIAAKVNLFLSVGPPDETGYHPIRTIFQSVGLFDELLISEAVEDQIVCEELALPEENTLTKTLRLLREPSTLPPLRIELRKGIPAESGLGGGSADAAAFLLASDLFLPAPISEGLKMDIASAVGADVAFFLVGGRARGEGYGQILTPMPDAEREQIVIVRPSVGCSTPDMYRRLDSKPSPWREFPLGDELYNDFERIAPCECLELTERLMVHGARDALLSGSGSAVFGRFGEVSAARQAAEALRREVPGAQVWQTTTLSRAESVQGPKRLD